MDKETNYMNFDLLKNEIIVVSELLDKNNEQLFLMKTKFKDVKCEES